MNSVFISFVGRAPPGDGYTVPPSVATNATRPYSSRPLPQWPAVGPMSSSLNGSPAILRISLLCYVNPASGANMTKGNMTAAGAAKNMTSAMSTVGKAMNQTK